VVRFHRNFATGTERHADKGYVTKTANFQNGVSTSPYLSKILSDFDNVWCTTADTEPDEILKSAIAVS